VFVLRPVPHHFLIWLLLAPLLLVEVHTLDSLLRVVALQDSAQARVALADVLERRDGPRGPEVRYQFRVPGAPQPFHARDAIGGGRVWVPLSQEAARQAARTGTLHVRYLPQDPWTNQAIGRTGMPVADSFCLWGLFLAVDLLWLAESLMIARNFARAQTLVERRTPRRLRFWESRRLPDPRYELKGW
jgi:hypothetical protein